MKKITTAIIIILGIIFAQQTNAQESDSLMLKDKAVINDVQTFIIDTQAQLKKNSNTSLSREDQLYILDLFREALRIILTFYPENSSGNQVIISKEVEEQMEEMIKKSLDEKLKEKKVSKQQ